MKFDENFLTKLVSRYQVVVAGTKTRQQTKFWEPNDNGVPAARNGGYESEDDDENEDTSTT